MLGIELPPGIFELDVDSKLPVYLSREWKLVPQDNGRAVYRVLGNSLTASDGEVDNDGMVGIDSGLGYWLGGNTPKPFDHSTGGSWYRMESGPWDLSNHATIQTKQEIGKWLHENFISKAVGPIPSRIGYSQVPAKEPIPMQIASGLHSGIRKDQLADIPMTVRVKPAPSGLRQNITLQSPIADSANEQSQSKTRTPRQPTRIFRKPPQPDQ